MHLRTSQSAAGPVPAMSAGAWAFSAVSQTTANALVDALVEAASRPQARAIVDGLLRMQGVDSRGREAAEPVSRHGDSPPPDCLASPFLPPV